MPWIYNQSTGVLIDPAGAKVCEGYSGCGEGKNMPSLQDVRDVGPIPCGSYSVGEPEDTALHGPFVLPLTPHEGNEMFGRSGFLIHGDSIERPGTASKGCVIMPRWAREEIGRSTDRELEVRP